MARHTLATASAAAGQNGSGPSQQDEDFVATLADALRAMDRAGIPCLLMGGVGSAALGRPRWTKDIDLFVAPEDARRTLAALAEAGFRTEERDQTWLYKGWKREVLVDVIFRCVGDVYLDDEMLARGTWHDFDGVRGHLIAPEDLVVLKASTADEHVPQHWWDALGLLASNGLDWDYLVRRARRHGVRRVLSLLLFAESKDMWVPRQPVVELFTALHGERAAEESHG